MICRRKAAFVWGPALMALVIGCGPGVAEGPLPLDTGQDIPSDGVSSDTDIQEFICPTPLAEPCAQEQSPLPKILDASEIDPSARLVAFTRDALLLQQGPSGSEAPIVWILDFGSPLDTRQHARAELPKPSVTSVRPVGLVYNLKPPFAMDMTVVLVEQSGKFILYGAHLEPGEGATADLLPLENGLVPGSGDFRGVSYLREKTQGPEGDYVNRICVFGDGIFCFDGSHWTVEIEPSGDRRFNDLGILRVGEGKGILAVGDGGLILVDTAAGWRELGSTTVEDLLKVSVNDNQFTAVGTNGALVHGTAEKSTACTVAEETIVSVSRFGERKIIGITTSGNVFTGELDALAETLCFTGRRVAYPIDARLNGCGSLLNYMVLTSSSLYGEQDCTTPI